MKMLINSKRFQSRFQEMRGIGFVQSEGNTRLALSDEDCAGRKLLEKWFSECGLQLSIDNVGNMFGRSKESDIALQPIIIGSHLDTVKRGGSYDGVLGVVAATEVAQTLIENNYLTRRPIWVANWTEEEGTRFAPGLVGSSVWAHLQSAAWASKLQDSSGLSFGAELDRIGYRGCFEAAVAPCAYIELHIDQGKTLEASGKIIGVPKGIVAFLFASVTVKGRADHVGGMEMRHRRDALRASAEMIEKLGKLADSSSNGLVASVGELRVEPNTRFTIAEEVIFSVDIRCWSGSDVSDAWGSFLTTANRIAKDCSCDFKFDILLQSNCLKFDGDIIQSIHKVAEELGYSSYDMVSGATHDAANLTTICPTAMILVPLIDGRSHTPEERTEWSHCEAGANALLHTVIATIKLNEGQEKK